MGSILEPSRRNLGLRVGMGVLVFLSLIALAAPLLAPFDPNQQIDPAAARLLPPGSSRWLIPDGLRSLAAEAIEREDESMRYLRLGQWVEFPPSTGTQTLEPQRRRFWLGTDRYGRDLLSRLLYGARVSLRIGLLTVALALLIGISIGSIAGLAGGWVDAVLMRGADALFAFPQLFLVLAAAAVWRSGEVAVIAILSLTSWMETSRLTRAEIIRLKRTTVIDAGRAIGATPWRLLTHHILPLALPPVLVHATLKVGDTILTEAALSFLGFGVQPPTASWGNLIAEAGDLITRAWWLVTFPGLALAATVLAFGLIGDSLNDLLDPRRQPP
jgi:peptide/nickel transport system permease protein